MKKVLTCEVPLLTPTGKVLAKDNFMDRSNGRVHKTTSKKSLSLKN